MTKEPIRTPAESGADDVERVARAIFSVEGALFALGDDPDEEVDGEPAWKAWEKAARAALAAMRPASNDADPMSALAAFETACEAHFEMVPGELPAVQEWVRVMSAAPAQGGCDE